MAVTAALVHASANKLRYLLTQDGAAGTTVTIANDAGATPDLQTDASLDPLRAVMRARLDGIDLLPAATPWLRPPAGRRPQPSPVPSHLGQ